ncbi:MAG TPA: phosphopantetheine-binding protein [Chthoniobacteraceae bacterium]|nr:phosphopantetheine-binding protein [Chthoniobacteraceae bacterium]
MKILAAILFHHNIRQPMAENDLRDSIKTMMVENLMLKVSKEEIRDDMPLFGPDGLGLDSIDALELVVSLEKKFGVSVPNSETARMALATVDSIYSYVVENRKAAP